MHIIFRSGEAVIPEKASTHTPLHKHTQAATSLHVRKNTRSIYFKTHLFDFKSSPNRRLCFRLGNSEFLHLNHFLPTMKNALIACAISASLYAGHACAGTFVIDDFNSGDQSITTSTKNVTVSDTNAIRTLSSTLTTTLPPVQSSATVSNGYLDITNGVGETSVVDLTWSLAALSIPTDISQVSFVFTVIASDGNPTSLTFTLDGVAIYTTTIPANTSDADVTFTVASSLLSSGGTLELSITGQAGWDLALDSIGISWSEPSNSTPEPTSVALLGLGLAGLGATRGRKRTTP